MQEIVKHITKHPKVREAGNIKTDLTRMLTTLYLTAGRKVPQAQELTTIVAIFEKDIRENFASLTLAEIGHALTQGIREADVPHISNVNLFRWVKAYLTNPDRLYAIQQAKQKALSEKTAPTNQQITQMNIEAVTLCFDNYKKWGYLQDFGNASYDFLDQQDILSYTPQKKRAFYQAAKISLASKAEINSKAKGDLDLMRQAARLIEGLAKREEDYKVQIVAEAKRLALKEYFDNLIEMDQHISEIFEQEPVNNQ